MPTWIIPMIWAALRALAYILQLVGLVGLAGFGFAGLMQITDKILEEATEGYENQDRP